VYEFLVAFAPVYLSTWGPTNQTNSGFLPKKKRKKNKSQKNVTAINQSSVHSLDVTAITFLVLRQYSAFLHRDLVFPPNSSSRSSFMCPRDHVTYQISFSCPLTRTPDVTAMKEYGLMGYERHAERGRTPPVGCRRHL